MQKQLGTALIFITLSIPSFGAPQVPKDAIRVLKSLPEQALTLDLVVGKSVATSYSYRAVEAAKAGIDVAYYESRAPLDYNLYASVTKSDARNEQISPFATTRAASTSYSLGVNTSFSTGTTLGFDITHGFSDVTFANGSFAYWETTTTLTVSQSLWKDLFGYGTRMNKLAGELRQEAARFDFNGALEEWVMKTIDIFYSAWQAQKQVRAALNNLARQKRLLKITKIKAKRGTAEKPDVLQIESATMEAENQLEEAKQVLGDRWRQLVTSLHFPESWLEIDPIYVPAKLDDPINAAESLCWQGGRLLPPPKGTTQSKAKDKKALAARALADKAENALAPDLSLDGSLAPNGIDTNSAGSTISESLSNQHPAWSVALKFNLPINQSAAKAEAFAARMEVDRAEAEASQANEDLVVDWKNSCANLARLLRQADRRKKALLFQQKRADLEEKNFKIGRSTPLEVIQAGSDATTANLNHAQTQKELRLAAWKIQRMQGKIQNYLDRLQKSTL